MSRGEAAPLVAHGWTIFAHPVFLDQIEVLIRQVEALKQKDAIGFSRQNATKRLAAIAQLAFDVIPRAPMQPEYRHGCTLGGVQPAFRAPKPLIHGRPM